MAHENHIYTPNEPSPENLEVFATHGSYEFPEELKPHLNPELLASERAIRGYSDFATAEIISSIPEDQRLVPRFGRIAGDPNRDLDAADLFRETTFAGTPVYLETLSEEVRQMLLNQSYLPYHREIINRLLKEHGEGNQIVAFDVHDDKTAYTGINPEEDLLKIEVADWSMPPFIISNQNNTTSSEALLRDLQSSIMHNFGLSKDEVWTNKDKGKGYLGGFVTTEYGNTDNPKLVGAKNPRQLIQIEMHAGQYLDEEKQSLKTKAATEHRKKLTKVLNEVAGDNKKIS